MSSQGIQYILSFADPNKTEERGHQSQLRADDRTARRHGGAGGGVDALVTKFDGTTGKPKLEIVLPAGNAYLSEGHVVFRRDSDAA